MVADESYLTASTKPTAFPISPNIRIVSIVTLSGNQRKPFSTNKLEWTLCIVGSSSLKETNREASFLQVASWNGLTFRFYQVGRSFDYAAIRSTYYVSRTTLLLTRMEKRFKDGIFSATQPKLLGNRLILDHSMDMSMEHV
jgi:hypothetical protein